MCKGNMEDMSGFRFICSSASEKNSKGKGLREDLGSVRAFCENKNVGFRVICGRIQPVLFILLKEN